MNVLAKFCIVACVGIVGVSQLAVAADSARGCAAQVAQWLDPASGKVIDSNDLLDQVATRSIVLLGEEHDNRDHHRWQHYMLTALHSRNANMVVGLEMFPRRIQPVLDDWSLGKLDEATFLQRSEWDQVWGYDASLYLPLLQFTRLYRLPTLGINIDRKLVSKVGEQGWKSLPVSERMGLSDPAPASEAYRQSLAELYAYKLSLYRQGEDEVDGEDAADLADILQDDGFNHFVDAQLTWDRAMAEALALAHRLEPQGPVVGIVGRGHLEYGYGIPHQLAAMGIHDVAVLLPLDADDDCADLAANLADAVFIVDAVPDAAPAPRARLGIMIESGDAGVRVMDVDSGSVAADSGLQEGDIIRRAAGFDTATTADLIEVVQRQAPGTWLPLYILRDDRELEVTARFPKSFE